MIEINYSFFIPADRFNQTKTIVRNLPSLRFTEEPRQFNGSYHIHISGNPGDIGRFNDYLVKCEEEILFGMLKKS